jgi:hypothetical protein
MVPVITNLSARPSIPENNGLLLRRLMRSVLRMLGVVVERRAKPGGKSTTADIRERQGERRRIAPPLSRPGCPHAPFPGRLDRHPVANHSIGADRMPSRKGITFASPSGAHSLGSARREPCATSHPSEVLHHLSDGRTKVPGMVDLAPCLFPGASFSTPNDVEQLVPRSPCQQ